MRGVTDTWGNQRRWLRGGLFAVILVAGALIGLLAGTRACAPAVAPSVREESYLVLLSTLYSRGESIDSIRGRLNGIGYDNAAQALIDLADKYDASKDRKQQLQAEELRQLADQLLNEGTPPTLAAGATKAATQSPTRVAGGQATTTPSLEATPIPQTTTQPSGTATAAPDSSPSPPPTKGTIQTSDGTPANLRTQPSTQGSEIIEGINPGTEVDVLQVVDGEAIDPSENRWFKVKHGEFIGYVYYKLVKTSE
jgi:hypothetical protein